VTRTANHGPTTPAVALDLETVVTVLYIGMFTPADWQRLGTAAMAQLVTSAAGDPRTRIPEVSELLAIGRRIGLPPTPRGAPGRRRRVRPGRARRRRPFVMNTRPAAAPAFPLPHRRNHMRVLVLEPDTVAAVLYVSPLSLPDIQAMPQVAVLAFASRVVGPLSTRDIGRFTRQLLTGIRAGKPGTDTARWQLCQTRGHAHCPHTTR
jgi:hypothetical protein